MRLKHQRRKRFERGWRDGDEETAKLPVYIGNTFSKSKVDVSFKELTQGAENTSLCTTKATALEEGF